MSINLFLKYMYEMNIIIIIIIGNTIGGGDGGSRCNENDQMRARSYTEGDIGKYFYKSTK